jgi:DNA-binding MarR family transcriptional regulator
MGEFASNYLGDFGVSAAERAVMEFLCRDGPRSVPEIAKAYQVSRQHIQVIVNSLIEKDLVGLEENPRHQRSPLAALSKKGHRLFARILAKDQEVIESIFAHVSIAQRKETRRVLETLLNNVLKGESR